MPAIGSLPMRTPDHRMDGHASSVLPGIRAAILAIISRRLRLRPACDRATPLDV